MNITSIVFGDGSRVRSVESATYQGSTQSGAQQQETGLFPTGEIRERPWADLSSDVLAAVFTWLPFEERLRTVPLVCKGWRTATSDPACWRHVDMEAWFQKQVEADYWWEFECEPVMERAVRNIVDRSCGQLEELRTFHCTDTSIDYVAERCHSLSILTIPNSLFVTDKSVTNLASGCPKLRELDLSDCYNVSNQALEAVGRNCKSLDWLSRNMVNRNLEPNRDVVERLSSIPGGDEEAKVVGNHMVNLKHLEMMRSSMSNEGLKSVVQGCPQLKSLNLACCTSISRWAVDKVSEKCPNIVDFTKPITPRLCVESHSMHLLLGY